VAAIQDRSDRDVWRQLDSGRVTHRFEPVVLGATLALIPVFVIEAEATSSRWKDVALAANWLIWCVFLVELAFILVVAPRKPAALRAHWLDALIVVVTAPVFGAFLSSLRYDLFGCSACCDSVRSLRGSCNGSGRCRVGPRFASRLS
jgi:hypothetical protein